MFPKVFWYSARTYPPLATEPYCFHLAAGQRSRLWGKQTDRNFLSNQFLHNLPFTEDEESMKEHTFIKFP